MNVSSSSTDQRIKLLQITDTHLFAPEDGSLLSVNTAESFHAVVAAILERQVGFDAILATGDISQDHSRESYEKFERGIQPLSQPCFWLPGNHDYKPSMGAILPSQQIQTAEHVLLGEHWQMILLDSQVVGVPHGRLSDAQLTLLDNQLSAHPDRYTLVLLHHHPLLVGSAWLDQHTLKDSEAFWEIVDKHSNVRAVLCGHIHQEMDLQRGDVRVMATPSTCVQFKPRSNDFALDRQSPGWRELELCQDGTLHTQVQRLPEGHFLPDFSASGY
ncbi:MULTISPECIES: 3',5'-cyclic-AMP phosphodiesterase [Vibrio]|uniref:3',5'-cyclic adenosine monophosphate phosphodiesterase CpdA n=1 Tax=Vibrio proteolyticus NBRC 13287 TaxID=1219065 RepID=U3A6L5_VIBPR|nr:MULTISPECIES: 3',5'-cyclic-AMP phosphodiesterase [Vibrio]NAW56745.1 3',5'-cyclic-AMP phosphodiesterase [Vibrio sp. V36_P2S2PM302]NAX21485.1 3',5'-cyclic-AMP phosphodiesterase [Vibrio sp. V39_P1S14PM300]NAX28162.1 3',5'-cyclic-AMP phosphodiesterase [Vibrio sp. V38_P2S17PM301]NAX29928.1 3',5'-cyclic-AMP phosphodiesterase [Vibrio sp. V37_P2S8PM304]GAD68972.1 3',5'-cyclic AMP phosphodiesterase CpdA [Vibrio proteolyticus NBRC 13287]